MKIDIYMLITLISAIALTILGFQLCGVHIPRKEDTCKLRMARIILAASYFILAVPSYAELFTGGEYNRKIAEVFTVATAAYQSLLFTATLLIFIRPLFVTRRRIWIQIGMVTVAVALFVLAALTNDARWIFFVALVAYAAQLTYYTVVFRRMYAESLASLEDYYDDDQHGQLLWAKFGFYVALVVGVGACISSGLPPEAFNVFTIAYIIFYAWFANRFANYVARVNYYLPAVMAQPKKDRTQVAEVALEELPERMEKLRLVLERWVVDKGYTRQEESREQIARELETDSDFLRWYFSTQMLQDFRSWRVVLRIEYAKELLAENPDVSINSIGAMVGFVSRSNFYAHFKKLTGVTPIEFRERIISKIAKG